MTDEREEREAGTKRDRTARLVRVAKVLQGAGERGVTPDEISRIAGVSKRTIYRDLTALEREVGIRIWSADGRWGADPEGSLPALKLTLDEAMAIFLSARLMARHADAYHPDLGGAFLKLAAALPEALGRHVERSVAVMAELPPDEVAQRTVADLTRAWASRRVVEFTYDSPYGPAKAPRKARVRPYLIEPSLATRALYLIGLDETRDELRTFKLDRIREVALTPATFADAPATAVEARLGSAWDMIADQPVVEVTLRFAPSVAGRVLETRWHPSERVERTPDGSLLWRARVSGVLEIRLWVLSWGDDVEVLEPAELRADIAATAARAAARYADGGTPGGGGGGA